MENDTSKDLLNYDNNYSNEKLRKFVQEFYEINEIWKSETMDIIKDQNKRETMLEKYYCEEKYIDLVQCLNKVGYHTLKRCEIPLEHLGKCVYDRMRIERFKNQ